MTGKLEFFTKSLLNQPLLATEEVVDSALDFLMHRHTFSQSLADFSGTKSSHREPSQSSQTGSIAQVDMIGPMMKRAMGMRAMCGAKGYDDYRTEFDAAFDNPKVDKVVLFLDSGGGDASGLFDLAQHVYDKKKASGKKMIAYVDGLAASAAYAMASVADEIIVEKTSSVGSIGVITTHADFSKKLEKDGVVVTPIYAGKFKAAGNPYEALSEDTKAMIQDRVDSLYTIFVDHVAEMRGMDAKDVRATDAKVFLANEAVKLGLADKVMSTDEFIAYLETDEDSMDFTSSNKTPQEKAVTEETTIDMAAFEQMQAQLAELTQAKAAADVLAAATQEKLDAAAAVLAAKEKAEAEAKLSGLQEQAKAWSSLGVDAETYAKEAMDASPAFVAMVSAALDKSITTTEASDSFEEIAAEGEGEGVEAKQASAVAAHIRTTYNTEA